MKEGKERGEVGEVKNRIWKRYLISNSSSGRSNDEKEGEKK